MAWSPHGEWMGISGPGDRFPAPLAGPSQRSRLASQGQMPREVTALDVPLVTARELGTGVPGIRGLEALPLSGQPDHDGMEPALRMATPGVAVAEAQAGGPAPFPGREGL